MDGELSELGDNRAGKGASGLGAILAGALITALGLGLGATVARAVGGWLVVLGWILLIYGIHTFGRRA